MKDEAKVIDLAANTAAKSQETNRPETVTLPPDFPHPVPKPGQTFYYRKNTWKEIVYNVMDFREGAMVRIDDNGLHGTEDAVNYFLNNPENWHHADYLTKMDGKPVKETRQQKRSRERGEVKELQKTAQEIADKTNAEDPNYRDAKKAHRGIATEARNNFKAKKGSRQRTPKVPAIQKTTGRRKKK